MKSADFVGNLAIFGGRPTFSEPVIVGRPSVQDKKKLCKLVGDILDSKMFSNGGKMLERFEGKLREITGVKHCLAVCNATVGLQLLLATTRPKTGRVIIPSFSFAAAAQAVDWTGLTPVFCDVNISTHNAFPTSVEKLITDDTIAIIPAHLWGRPCEIDTLTHIARRHGIKIFFDAAHAFDCSYAQKKIGNFGDAEVFSFHATKFVNAFEGGAICTNDPRIASEVSRMRNFGFDDGVLQQCGTNAKMSEFSAAAGLLSLEQMPEIKARNAENYEQYVLGLLDAENVAFIEFDPENDPNYQYVVFEVIGGSLTRDEIASILEYENIFVKRYFQASDRPFINSTKDDLSVTQYLEKSLLCFPTGMSVDSLTIAKICAIMRFISDNSEKIKEMLVKLSPYLKLSR